MTVLTALLVVIIFVILFVVGIYNSLVKYRNQVKNAFSQIAVQLTRRYDLIPNLIESVKGYMKHERETLEAVITARNSAVSGLSAAAKDPSNAAAIQNLGGAEAVLTQSMGKLFALAEAYPDLKANQNMLQFQEELASTENKVSFARQAFNDAVMIYNTKRESFPNNIIAGMFNFSPAESFEIEDPIKREVPKVSFS